MENTFVTLAQMPGATQVHLVSLAAAFGFWLLVIGGVFKLACAITAAPSVTYSRAICVSVIGYLAAVVLMFIVAFALALASPQFLQGIGDRNNPSLAFQIGGVICFILICSRVYASMLDVGYAKGVLVCGVQMAIFWVPVMLVKVALMFSNGHPLAQM